MRPDLKKKKKVSRRQCGRGVWEAGVLWETLSPSAAVMGRGGPCSGSAEALGDVCVGQLNLRVGCTGVGELVSGVGVPEVPPQARHLNWDIVVAVFLGHNL